MAKIVEVQEVAVAVLKPYERNAKIHSGEQVQKIAESIKEFGFLSPCLIDREKNIIAGHGRVEAAKLLGLETVPCVFIEGLSDEQRRAYILADNKLTEMGEWDIEIVSQELEALKNQKFNIELTGFTFNDITQDDIDFSDLDEKAEEIEKSIPKESKISEGDIFRLGGHLLICGDSTDLNLIKRLMGAEKADLLLTDPPYNVDISNENGDKIANDNMPENQFYAFLLECFKNAHEAMAEGAGFYIWHADSHGGTFRNACEDAGLHIRQNLIWVKNSFTIGRQDYQWRHEPCLYGWKEGAAHFFVNDRTKPSVFETPIDIDAITEREAKDILRKIYRDNTTVLFYNKPIRSELHPTMKPVNLIERLIINSTKENEIVFDPFGGSGTTLIACENLNRKCRMVEYDPHYCDVIIERWETLTGQKAVLLDE